MSDKPAGEAKPKKPVDQKTLDMLAKGRQARADKIAAEKAASPAPAAAPAPTTKPEVPVKPAAKPARCASCWCRPCDKSGKRCAK